MLNYISNTINIFYAGSERPAHLVHVLGQSAPYIEIEVEQELLFRKVFRLKPERVLQLAEGRAGGSRVVLSSLRGQLMRAVGLLAGSGGEESYLYFDR